MRSATIGTVLGAVVLLVSGSWAASASGPWVASASGLLPQQEELPESFEQVVPRGRIASIDEPEFVPADEAQIADDSWVLGVVVEGQPRAYSLKLLNAHEVVNDSVGETRFAAVW